MSFERALRSNPPPSGRVGDVWLRYDPPVLVGETRHAPARARLLPELVMGGALAAGLAAVALLLGLGELSAAGGAATWVAGAFAAIGGGLFLLSNALERRARGRRRFVLHFGTETLRLDTSGGVRGPISRTVHFDAVRDLYVLVGTGGRHTLVVDVEVRAGKPPLSVVMVDGVSEAEADELQRVWTTLRAAFGLRPPPAGG